MAINRLRQHFFLNRHPLAIAIVVLAVVYLGQSCAAAFAATHEYRSDQKVVMDHTDDHGQYGCCDADETSSVSVHQHHQWGVVSAASAEMAIISLNVSNLADSSAALLMADDVSRVIVPQTQSPPPLRIYFTPLAQKSQNI